MTRRKSHNSVSLRGFLQLMRLFQSFVSTSDDRPASAIGGEAVQKPSVLTSAQSMARLRRWFRYPPLQLLVPAPRDSLRSSKFADKTPLLASGVGLQISGRDSLATGAWRLEESQTSSNSDSFHRSPRESVRDRPFCHFQLTAWALHPDFAIQPIQEVAHTPTCTVPDRPPPQRRERETYDDT